MSKIIHDKISVDREELIGMWLYNRKTINERYDFFKHPLRHIWAKLLFHANYNKYSELANYGALIIHEFEIPYKKPKKLFK